MVSLYYWYQTLVLRRSLVKSYVCLMRPIVWYVSKGTQLFVPSNSLGRSKDKPLMWY